MAKPDKRRNTPTVRIADKARQLARFFSDTYRPELHYMRGPGPKWREKHAQESNQLHATELRLPNLGKAGA